MAKYLFVIAMVLYFAVISSRASAQTSTNVPVGDRTYRWIEILAGAGLVTSDFPEQRPWSRLEFARLIREAETNFKRKKENTEQEEPFAKYSRTLSQNRFLKDILAALKLEFRDELAERRGAYAYPLEEAYAQYQYLGEESVLVPYNGLEPVTGRFHPLVDNQEGRHYLKGSSFDLQTRHRVQLGKYLCAFARPQLEVTIPSGNLGNSLHFYFKSLGLKTGWKNIELEFARDQIVWGNAPNGGVMFSNNPRGFDMTQFVTPHPFHLPWVFKKMGTFKFGVFMTNLGPQYSPQYPWMSSAQLTWHITPFIRLGGNHQVTFGGKGFKTLPPLSALLETLGVPMAAGDPTGGGYPTNRSYSFFGSFRVPALRNTEFLGQIFFEDISFGDTAPVLRNYLTYLANIHIPRLTYDGRLSATLEYEYVGSRPYGHIQYTSGWTLNQEFIAHTYGQDTQHVRTDLRYTISPNTWANLSLIYIRRLNNFYTYVSDGTGSGRIIAITTLSSGPKEHHWVALGDFHLHLTKQWQLYTQAGLDVVQNANFIQGHTTPRGLLKFGIMWRKNIE